MRQCRTFSPWAAVVPVLLAFGWAPETARAAEKVHFLVGLGLGGASYRPSGQRFWDNELASEISVAVEYSWFTDPLNLRLGGQVDWGRSSNVSIVFPSESDESRHRGFGVYGKLKMALLYGGLGLKRVYLARDVGVVPHDTSGWFLFQLLGLEVRIVKISLNLEYQRTGGTFKDAPGPEASLRYRRHMVRLLGGIHL
ncbi:MAG: porin family protein [Acidobacteria bacterium]|nr:porin family protein [Acidobacteriota bacterium]MDW7985537.1 outer membrane beta-barrel protein [Acidobacteriota bacterium]